MVKPRGRFGLRWLVPLTLILVLALSACRSDTAVSPGPGGTPTAASGGGTSPTASSGGGVASPAAATEEPLKASDEGISPTEIKLGTYWAQSGALTTFLPQIQTYKALLEEANKKGGVNGRKITYLIEDDGYQPNRTVEVTKKLVEQDKIFAIFLPLGTPTTNAVIGYLEEKGVPTMIIGSGDPSFTVPPRPLAFGYQINYIAEGKILGKYVQQAYAGKKFGILYQNDGLGKNIITGVESTGVQLSEKQAYEPSTTDLNSQMLKLKESGADVILMATSTPFAALALKARYELGMTAQMVGDSAMADTQLFKLVGNDAAIEGTLVAYQLPAFDDLADPGIKAHNDWLKANQPSLQVSQFTVYGQYAAELTLELLKRAGRNPTRKSLIDAAENMKDWKASIGPPLTLSKTNHTILSQLKYFAAKGGKFVPVSDWITPPAS